MFFIKKNKITMSLIALSLFILMILFFKNSDFTGYAIYDDTVKLRLGYCPTMFPEAEKISENKGYDLIEYNSASQVLRALRNNEIQKGLIGRKAYFDEIDSNFNKDIIESGFTLVSNKKEIIDYSQLNFVEIYAYSDLDQISHLFPDNQNIKFIEKQDILNKISEGKYVLISWDDWKNDFELIVVMAGFNKVRHFRGVFLYSNI